MKEENHRLFLMLAGQKLSTTELEYFKSQLFNEGLDISELFRTAVVCSQFSAAKLIIDFGYDQNKDETTPFEIFICLNLNGSKFCLDYYLSTGLQITQSLIDKLLKIALEESEHFDYEKSLMLIEKLKHKMIK